MIAALASKFYGVVLRVNGWFRRRTLTQVMRILCACALLFIFLTIVDVLSGVGSAVLSYGVFIGPYAYFLWLRHRYGGFEDA